MKKIWIILLLNLFAFGAMAQTEKGTKLLGVRTTLGMGQSDGLMGLAFNRSTLELADGSELEDRMTSFFISSKGGYFFADGFAAGLEVAISTSSGTTETDGIELESNFSFLGVGPFARYYFPSGKLLPFAEINSLFGTRSQETLGSGLIADTKFSVANFGWGFGLAFLLGERSSLDLMASYFRVRQLQD
ncbi:outer membrane beta-barrel protein [Cyclobacterium xiamenense]|uniref:outer membrane beta-barrel protein n=1 Tax=Cyclobacterium xiamenense TaxID=1297121 RepID=UPI0012B73883|nr:outer membrane beta-barrel protein [Cyclobacterium xiamenense]